MTLTDSELLALALPVFATVMAGAVARLTHVSVMRRRRRRIDKDASAPDISTSGEQLVEIKPEMLLSIRSHDRPRYFVRSHSLEALLARANSGI